MTSANHTRATGGIPPGPELLTLALFVLLTGIAHPLTDALARLSCFIVSRLLEMLPGLVLAVATGHDSTGGSLCHLWWASHAEVAAHVVWMLGIVVR